MSEQKTTAVTEANPHPDRGAIPFDFTTYQQGGVIGFVIAVVASVLALRRRAHKDSHDIKRDDTESEFIKTLRLRADQMTEAADQMAHERNQALVIAAKLETENKWLVQTIQELRARQQELEQQVKFHQATIEALSRESKQLADRLMRSTGPQKVLPLSSIQPKE